MPARDKKPLEGCEKPNTALRHDTGGQIQQKRPPTLNSADGRS